MLDIIGTSGYLLRSSNPVNNPVTRSTFVAAGGDALAGGDSSLAPMGKARRVRAPKTAELVAKQLRDRVIRGELKAGQALPGETALMAHFSISRQTLREALRVLESESLLSITRGVNGGPRVMAPNADVAARHFGLILQHQGTTLADVFKARQLIEPPAARLVALRRRDRAPKILRAIIRREEAVLQDDTALAHEMTSFHETLVGLANNQTLLLMLRTIDGIFERHVSRVTIAAGQAGDTTRDKRLGLRAQEKLVKLIEAGDASQAEAFWQKNLETIGKVLLRRHSFDRVIDILE